jgi:peptide/nickel transport system substrate-binding protein
MNTREPPFDRLAVRRALNYALDRNRIVGLSGGPLTAQATCQILPPNLFGYRPYCPYTLDPGPAGSWTAPDFTAAERLVRSSGTQGMQVAVLIAPDPTVPAEGIGAYTVSVLDRLGYRASLKVVDSSLPGPLGDSRARPQIGWFTWFNDYPAPSNTIEPLLSCRSFAPGDPDQVNVAEFCDPRIDAQIRHAEALQTRDQTAAGDAWGRIDHRLVDRAPWVPLYNPRALTALSARVGNYQYHPFWQVLLDQLWVR